jgi:hypothetical protein
MCQLYARALVRRYLTKWVDQGLKRPKEHRLEKAHQNGETIYEIHRIETPPTLNIQMLSCLTSTIGVDLAGQQ